MREQLELFALDDSPRARAGVHTVARYRLELVSEASVPYGDPIGCSQPTVAAEFLFPIVDRLDREVMGALFLDTRHRIVGHTIAYVGTLKRTAVEPRGILAPALLANAGDLLGIRLVDHLILGERPAFVSLSHRGQLPGGGDA